MLPITDVYTILLTAPLMITASGVIFSGSELDGQGTCWRVFSVIVVKRPDDMGWKLAYALPLLQQSWLSFVNYTQSDCRTTIQDGVSSTGLLLTIAGFASISYCTDWSILFPILGATLAVTIAHVMTVLTVRLAPLSVTSPGRYSNHHLWRHQCFPIILQEVPSTGTIIGSIIHRQRTLPFGVGKTEVIYSGNSLNWKFLPVVYRND